MCKCENLMNVPKNKKALVVLAEDNNLFDARDYKAIMELNHEDDGTPFAFINYGLTINSSDLTYADTINIQYCPFCGRKLY